MLKCVCCRKQVINEWNYNGEFRILQITEIQKDSTLGILKKANSVGKRKF